MEASDEKVKRFRLHVVKELYETEKDYTESLEFTVEHIQAKLYLKAANDKSLSDEMLRKLFCNIGDLLQTHKNLVSDLDEIIGSSPSSESTIAMCYLKHEAGLRKYKVYGENNEQAQRILYELENDQSFKAFFVGLMLLGGKTDVSISSYLFKPIQRICKYPLLFRELLKYTPVDHSDYNATNYALSMMKDICSVINEAKRRVECLEKIADWQNTVDGWEGSPVIDLCLELVKEGQLVKISGGNIQERMFFLFDSLLVYCRRNTILQLRSKTDPKLYHFRGRIPVANIEIENIEDGTCDYHTNRVQVNNGWKVRNLAKNKWFVLIAKTPMEKQQWIDAIRAQKDRVEREKSGYAKETRTLMLEKGEKLHKKIVNEGRVLQEHRYRFKAYSKSFTGSDFGKWLIEIGEAGDAAEAVRLGQALLENGVIHHVADRHQFKFSQLIYRFRIDDGTFRLASHSTLAKGLRVYIVLHSQFSPLVRNHRSGLRQTKSSVSGSGLVDWLVAEQYFSSRDEAVDFGSQLMAIGVLKHSTDDHKFKDSSSLYYQFVSDVAGNEQLPVQTVDFVPISTCSCQAKLIPYDFTSKDYGFGIEECYISTVTSGSVAEDVGTCVGQEIIGIGGQYLNNVTSPYLQCMSIVESHRQLEAPLELIVKRFDKESVKIMNDRLGFQLKGSHPVVVNKVDKALEAAKAGITPGCCILAVEGSDVSSFSHEQVVTAIKTAQETGKETISFNIGVYGNQHLTHYQFESTEDVLTEVSERVMESPFVFSIPGMLFKLYDEEARSRAKFLSKRSKQTSSYIEDYITELQVQADSYRKYANGLSNPRYPSFRPFGKPSSQIIESCPVNLHTVIMEVGPSMKGSTSPTPSSDPDGSVASSYEGPTKNVGYCSSTMALPSLMNRKYSENQVKVLHNCRHVRDLLSKFDSLYTEISRDSELLQRLSKNEQVGNSSPLLTTLPRKFVANSRPQSPNISKRNDSIDSPFLSPRGAGRSRNVSFVNPSSLLKIVLDGLSAKVSNLEKLLQDDSFLKVVETVGENIKKKDSESVSLEGLMKITMLKTQLANLSDETEISAFSVSLLKTVKSVKNDADFYLEVALGLHDNVEITDAWDRLFCHCLVGVVTGFASQLLIAARGQFNHSPEFIKEPSNASQQWLDFIAANGLLVCFTTLLTPSVASELAGMKDMVALMSVLKSVTFHVKETATPKSSQCNLPNVILSGGHNHLQVTFELPLSLLEYIPESLLSGEPIVLHPVLFNSCLEEVDRSNPHGVYEQEMNELFLGEIKTFYRGLRQYHLSKAVLPQNPTERTIALQEAARPLSVIDDIMQQLEGTIHQSRKTGTQSQVFLAELLQRMGGVNIFVCESGVHRSQKCVSLEETLLLSRYHGLPCRNFRSSLSTLRKTGSLPYIEEKISLKAEKELLKNSPWIFRLTDS